MNISFEQFLMQLVVSAAAGWIAALIMKVRWLGPIGGVVVGVLGSFLGRWLLGLIGFGVHTRLAYFFTALLGALLLFWLISLLPKRSRK